MVSPSDNLRSSSLAIRGAASVVGSAPSERPAASSRVRRYNRSHAGGTSYVPLNEFPVFANTGDVEIVVRVRSGHENRYLLHRDTLARCSEFFEASTSKEWSRAQVVTKEDRDDRESRALPAAASIPGGEVVRVGAGGADMAASNSNSLSAPDSRTLASAAARNSFGTPVSGRRRWRYELDLGQDDNDRPILVQKEEENPAVAAAQSLFGGGSSGASNTPQTAPYRAAPSPSKPVAPTHSNPSFFRSVANLALSHDRHSSRHGSHGSNQHGHYSSPMLPPPTAEETDILRDYDNLFRIMYNYAPLLDGVNIADAYVQCKSLLAVADEYGALAVVGPRVDHHLLQFQSRLWRQIAKYPISYLRLGYLARSRVIFQEAFVHVVGQWPSGERSLRAALPDKVLDLIEDKVDELCEAISRVESCLIRLHLYTRNGERVSPSTSYLDWLAVSLFRQWLVDNTTPPAQPAASQHALPSNRAVPERRGAPTVDRYHGGQRHGGHRNGRGHGAAGGGRASSSSSTDSSGRAGARQETALTLHVRTTNVPPLLPPLNSLGRTYRTLGSAAGPSYLGHDECKRFLKLTPEHYSRDNLRRFEKRIDEMKAMAREVVRPLMGSGLELDMGRGGSGVHGSTASNDYISYFTCTYLCERDLPWDVNGM